MDNLDCKKYNFMKRCICGSWNNVRSFLRDKGMTGVNLCKICRKMPYVHHAINDELLNYFSKICLIESYIKNQVMSNGKQKIEVP